LEVVPMRVRLPLCALLLALSAGAVTCSGGCRQDQARPPAGQPPAAGAAADPQAEARVTADLVAMRADVTRDPTLPGQPATRVSFWGTRVTDAYLKELAPLAHLNLLDLRGTPVTDAGLKELPALPELRELDLSETQVTDAGLKELARLPRLDSLHLDKSRVTDAGLADLARLKQLRSVTLWQCQGVTEAGAKELQRALPQAHVTFHPAGKVGRPR
jgi:hypothetical protein